MESQIPQHNQSDIIGQCHKCKQALGNCYCSEEKDIRSTLLKAGMIFPENDEENKIFDEAHKDFDHKLTGKEIDPEKILKDAKIKEIENYIDNLDNLIDTGHFPKKSIEDYVFEDKELNLKDFVKKGREIIRQHLMLIK